MTRKRYPVIRGDLPPGLVTLAGYGPSIGRSAKYVKGYWQPIAGFPEPVGELPPNGRHGGGRGELVYSRAALDAFRLEHDHLWGARTTRLITGHDPAERVTLEEFAVICGITPDPGRFPGCPPAGDDGRRMLSALAGWHNALPAGAGPKLAVTRFGPGRLVTEAEFAGLAGVHLRTVTQYQNDPGYPDPADARGERYRLGELAAWWNARPGKRGPGPAPSPPGLVPALGPVARRRADTVARVERALQVLGGSAPENLTAAGRLRIAHPRDTLEELGRRADPPVSLSAMADRLRRLLAMADSPPSGRRRDGTVARVERALQVLGGSAPENLAAAGRLRIAHPRDTLEELGRRADPPVTGDVIAGRLRRLLLAADHGPAAQAAGVGTPAQAERALQILGGGAPEHLAAAGRLRTANPGASLAELGRLADPPVTRYVIAGRLRRLLAMAGRRASTADLPGA